MQFGVPTVVESAVMVNESLDLFIKKYQNEARSNDYLNELQDKDNYEDIKEDELIDNMKNIVARGINYSL